MTNNYEKQIHNVDGHNAIRSPIAFPGSGVYDAPHMITLLCATQGAAMHYTMDGTAPTLESPLYNPYLLIPLEQFGHEVPTGKRNYTIQAMAVLDDKVSDVVHLHYEINPRSSDVFISEMVFPGVRLIRDFQNNKMYIIKGSLRSLLIDAGMGTGDLHRYVEKYIDDLPLDVFITHGHPDHIAAMGQFLEDYDVFMHHADLPLLQRFIARLNYDIDLDRVKHIEEGDTFDLGNRQLKVYHLPGHSKGCLVLHDETNNILFSGDAIGSNGPTIVDALWMQMSQDGIDQYLSALQDFRSKVAGKIKYICGGHGALYLEGETYLDNLQEAAQQLVDQGIDILVPSPRPAGVWKSVFGDRLTDRNWASINVNRDTCLSAPPDQIASLSNLQIKGVALYEPFKPGILQYIAKVNRDLQRLEIIPTATSRRYRSIIVNGHTVKSGMSIHVSLNDKVNVFSIKVVAPDGETNNVYTIEVMRM